MGYFSWLTADTQEQVLISNERPVYLLQPNGSLPIKEEWYEGYGEFGGTDAFDWLADMNIEQSILKRAEELGIEKRMLGIYIGYDYYIDTRDGKKYSYVLSELFEDLNPFPGGGNYASKIDGVEINTLIKEGVWERRSFSDYFGEVKYPLKFSYNKNAKYEDLSASKDDPNQGCRFN